MIWQISWWGAIIMLANGNTQVTLFLCKQNKVKNRSVTHNAVNNFLSPNNFPVIVGITWERKIDELGVGYFWCRSKMLVDEIGNL